MRSFGRGRVLLYPAYVRGRWGVIKTYGLLIISVPIGSVWIGTSPTLWSAVDQRTWARVHPIRHRIETLTNQWRLVRHDPWVRGPDGAWRLKKEQSK